MATITGTTATDNLLGTSGNDTLIPYGVTGSQPDDLVSGGMGGDIYDLRAPVGTSSFVPHFIIDDNGTDGALDMLVNVGGLVQTASLGYVGFATALRDGDDMIIITPYKPGRFRDPSKPSYEITIVDHYAGEQVEVMVAGGISYQLVIGAFGTGLADLMAGSNSTDFLRGRAGDDYMTGNDGIDRLYGGAGNDYLFGGNGGDDLRGQSGTDRIYGGAGNDTAKGGSGDDILYLQDGDDRGKGGGGNDYIYGQDGNDRLIGGAGQDMLSGGRGNDTMIGGQGGDTYRYGYDDEGLGGLTSAGHDVIRDKGGPATYNDFDRIVLFGFYGPTDGSSGEGFARLGFEKTGNTMRVIIDGGTGSITVRGQFANTGSAIEEVQFNAGYWTPLRFKILDGATTNIGDDRRYDDGTGGEWNEVLFGTNGDDQVFGNSGTNFIWLGAGADTLIYKEVDPQTPYGNGGGPANDIVQDFDVTEDRMDFSEINGISMADLTITDNAAGNAVVSWDSGTIEISDIQIELRGVSAAQLLADHFVF